MLARCPRSVETPATEIPGLLDFIPARYSSDTTPSPSLDSHVPRIRRLTRNISEIFDSKGSIDFGKCKRADSDKNQGTAPSISLNGPVRQSFLAQHVDTVGFFASSERFSPISSQARKADTTRQAPQSAIPTVTKATGTGASTCPSNPTKAPHWGAPHGTRVPCAAVSDASTAPHVNVSNTAGPAHVITARAVRADTLVGASTTEAFNV